MKKVLFCAVSILACSLSMFSAAAQEFPSRPITFMVGFAPGGAVDIVARTLGAQLQEQVRQPVVIENRAGANSNVAAVAAARSKPDGYTLLVGANGMTTNMALYANPGFDVQKDFTPVSLIGDAPPVIAAGPAFSGTSLRDLVEQAKSKPGALNYGSPGAGSSAHLMMELFQRTAGIALVHVPYKGMSPAVQAVAGAETAIVNVGLGLARPHITSGRVIALAKTGFPSKEALPGVPALTAAYPDAEYIPWTAVFAPKGAPRAIVARLNAETTKALAAPEFLKRMAELDIAVIGGSPEDLDKTLRADVSVNRELVKSIGLKLD